MVNIPLADYNTIAQFGTRSDFDAKLQMMGQTLDDVVDFVDEYGISLLGACLSFAKIDFAKEILEKNPKVNHVTNSGYNEFHLIASHIYREGALDVAWMLLDRGVSLTCQDKKYKNTAIFTLFLESHRRDHPESIPFIEACFRKLKKSDFDIRNKAGFTLRQLVERDASEHLKRVMEEIQ